MTPKELYDLHTKVFNEAYDGIAELMRQHECYDLDLTDYEDDLYLPPVTVWDDVGQRTVIAKVTDIHLVPGHIEFDFALYHGGGHICRGNEVSLDVSEMLDVYSTVDTIFRDHASDFENQENQ